MRTARDVSQFFVSVHVRGKSMCLNFLAPCYVLVCKMSLLRTTLGPLEVFLIFQRLFCTLFDIAGTVNSVLVEEIVKRFNSVQLYTYMYMYHSPSCYQ